MTQAHTPSRHLLMGLLPCGQRQVLCDSPLSTTSSMSLALVGVPANHADSVTSVPERPGISSETRPIPRSCILTMGVLRTRGR